MAKRKSESGISNGEMGKKKSRSMDSTGEIGKRKPRKTLISRRGRRREEKGEDHNQETTARRARNGEEREKGGGGGEGGFFACYLLTSLNPRHKGSTYIGFTVNPRRRIRQHNGEIGSGASRTKAKRPWEMVFCIYGFPTHVSALQFEWAWQHPKDSLAVREAAATFKSLSGLANKIKLGCTMLTLPAWQNLNLTVNFFSTQYTKHAAGCPSLPECMRVQVCSMDELPCYEGPDHNNKFADEYDRDDNEICSNISIGYGPPGERSAIEKVYSCRDHWKSIEETTHDQNGQIEEIGTTQSGDLNSSAEYHTQPPFIATPPLQMSSLIATGTFTALGGLGNRDVFELIEDDRVEIDQPASTELQTLTAADTDRTPIRSHILPGEVEFVDLLSPSPGYSISFRSKKREISEVCPEIIDLTKSPIFL